MDNLIQILFAIGGIQGLILATLLCIDKTSNTPNKLLGITCLLLALCFLIPFAFNATQDTFLYQLKNWVLFVPASFGALNFLYYRHALSDKPLTWHASLYFIPFALCYLINLDWLTDPSHLLVTQYLSGQIDTPLNVNIGITLMFIQAIAFNSYSAWYIYRVQVTAQDNLTNFDPDIFRWLWTCLLFTLSIWSLKFFAEYTNVKAYSNWADALIVLFIYSVAIAQWRNPTLFRVLPSEKRVEELKPNKIDIIQNTKQTAYALDLETRANLLELTNNYMKEQKPFLNPNLTLNDLANALGISTHHLSEVLNQEAGKNFYNYINQYRIELVIEKLKQQGNSKILDLAFDSGFSSKSTFNAVFKLFVGQTPTQFKKSLQ